MVTTESGNDRKRPPPSCRDKGRMWGRVGALCLSWWHDEWSGFPEANRPVSSPPGQAQGPLIHPTPPLVPTGCIQDAGRTFPDAVGTIHREPASCSLCSPVGQRDPSPPQHRATIKALPSPHHPPSPLRITRPPTYLPGLG